MSSNWSHIQSELRWFFKDRGLQVAVGLKPGGGLVIRSQDERIDASNIGKVIPQGESSGREDTEAEAPS